MTTPPVSTFRTFAAVMDRALNPGGAVRNAQRAAAALSARVREREQAERSLAQTAATTRLDRRPGEGG